MENCSDDSRCSTTVEYIGYIYILPFICSLAVIFNVLVLLVFARSNFQSRIGSSTLTYLRGLAVADGMACLVSLPIGFLRCLESNSPGQEYFWNWYDKFVFLPISNTFGISSVWITVAVSLERCIFVSSNKVRVRTRAMFKTRTAKVALVLIYVFAFAMSFPMYYYYEGLSAENNTLTISTFGKSVNYEIYSWIRMFLAKLIPIIVVISCNIILIKTTWKKNRKISMVVGLPSTIQTRRTQTQKKLTYMLLSISTVFVLCNVAEPFAHTGVYKVLFGVCSIYTEEYYTLGVFVNIFEFIAFASNFVSYCVFHQHFRDTLKLVITCRKNKITPINNERRVTRQSHNPYVLRSLAEIRRYQDNCIEGKIDRNEPIQSKSHSQSQSSSCQKESRSSDYQTNSQRTLIARFI